ncbi:class I SAM-dependent methyltransferase [Acetonema longum]|uniref:Methyltransferase type 11 n=1 Tax=Acetonema longum DSM 6540 TaxID=1009370 RepID=F7NJ32_9FIRM|nr:class I SAM-dependent methyltransferase [Acetonema longum]EGO63922.1 Methyltransferase type 11 [Acetonema longum DSM 6540]
MNKPEPVYDAWVKDATGENEMEERHRPGWQAVIDAMKEQQLTEANVLDFGCNQGGFLRYLYERKPFKKATGIDLGAKSIAIAEQRRGQLPLRYAVTGSPEKLGERFDIAFSLSVIYLIGDLAEHAAKIKLSLNPGGVYYATYTDYHDNPSAAHFLQAISQDSVLKPYLHTIDAIAAAFFAAGFQVGVKKMIPADFVELAPQQKYILCNADYMKAKYESAYLFRFSLPRLDEDGHG